MGGDREKYGEKKREDGDRDIERDRAREIEKKDAGR